MDCKLPLQKVIAEKPLCFVSAGTGAVVSASPTFRVWGFHALLRVVVVVFFQRTIGTNTSTSTWSASAVTKDAKGQKVTLQPVWTGTKNLEDGHEVNSAADGIEYTANIASMATSQPQGTWMARVTAEPNLDMNAELFCDLCARLTLDVDPQPPTIKASTT
jgi:hypothetical protein